jgi:hypothetical protein
MLMTVSSLVPMKASLLPLARAPPPRCLLADAEDMLRYMYAFMLPTATGVATSRLAARALRLKP